MGGYFAELLRRLSFVGGPRRHRNPRRMDGMPQIALCLVADVHECYHLTGQ